MKKRLLLGLLAAPLILASCGGDKPADSKDPETSIGDQSNPEQSNSQGGQPGDESSIDAPTPSSAPELTRAEKVTALFAKMATGASSSFVDPGMATTEYYGETKGMLNFYNDQYLAYGATNGGIAVVPNYGIYQVSYDVETDSVDGAQIFSPNKTLKVSDLTATTKLLGTAAATVTFAESARTHTFSTTDNDFVAAFAALDGYGSDISAYTTKKVTFNISEDGESLLNMTLDLTGAADKTANPDVKETGLKIEKVGTTINLDLDVFTSNFAPATPTAWSAAAASYLNSLYQGYTLPFLSGATYASIETIGDSNEFIFMDLGCGDKTVSYGAQLTAAGFKHDATDPTLYTKILEEETETRGAIVQTVNVEYQSAAGTPYAAVYPNGIFEISAYLYAEGTVLSEAGLNQILAAEASYDDPSVSVFPTLNIGSNLGIEWQDATADMQAAYPDTDELLYGIIKVYYATLAEAQAAVTSLTAQFISYGYQDYTADAQAYGYPDDAYLILDDGYDFDYTTYDYFEYSCIVRMQIAKDASGNYLGYLLISVDHYGEQY